MSPPNAGEVMVLATTKPGSQMIWAVVKQGYNLALDALDTRLCTQGGRSLRGGQAFPRRRAGVPVPVRPASPGSAVSIFVGGEPEMKRRPAPGLGGCPELPTIMGLDDGSADGKAHPHAARLCGEELLE